MADIVGEPQALVVGEVGDWSADRHRPSTRPGSPDSTRAMLAVFPHRDRHTVQLRAYAKASQR